MLIKVIFITIGAIFALSKIIPLLIRLWKKWKERLERIAYEKSPIGIINRNLDFIYQEESKLKKQLESAKSSLKKIDSRLVDLERISLSPDDTIIKTLKLTKHKNQVFSSQVQASLTALDKSKIRLNAMLTILTTGKEYAPETQSTIEQIQRELDELKSHALLELFVEDQYQNIDSQTETFIS